MTSSTARLTVGDPAPPFALPDATGQTVRLADFAGQRVVLYFYPRDNTPGCTKEACAFNAVRDELSTHKAQVIGISPDSVTSHEKFAAKFGLTFPLLSDPEHVVAEQYGVWQEKKNYGRTYFGIVRTTFIIDEQGRIARIFPNVKVEGHAAQVLQALAEMDQKAKQE
ncbi:thioredoxin-dependent thiol peroxidase [Chloracidobacterium thermophilum]|jgi:peroxiredoxin Q/BCP|uniref:thioredoxin-dependent peroxiredoxin n=1 Tax=Chloracidobacterium thermophilum (strain B) TaxID=981222 RepID=G2LE82_CHLTF|nr:thioredoxin-dependent thiol peroxidase [Chloracidobacterium thermophilum]AEP11302.1 Peroxiredoxin [Chloracidobacterium thermophilum B]QUV79212.1 thioredoxin-dependent thiol peroxidase [Chloracidobacterium thermophilum]